MLGLAKKIFGSSNDRSVKAMMARVQSINALEPSYAALSEGELRAKTDEVKAALAASRTAAKASGRMSSRVLPAAS